MAVCKMLRLVYGRDTRSAQVVNVLLSGTWAIMLYLHQIKVLLLDIPESIVDGITGSITMAALASVFSVIGLLTCGKRHQVFKFFGLSLASVFYGILANGYFSAYPPLEMMLVICVALVLWFVGGLFYIVRCEGIDGNHST